MDFFKGYSLLILVAGTEIGKMIDYTLNHDSGKIFSLNNFLLEDS